MGAASRRILTVGLDPNVVTKLRAEIPDAEVVQGPLATALAGEIPVDLIVCAPDHAPDDGRGTPFVVVLPAGTNLTPGVSEADAVLRRPLASGEVARTLRPLLGLGPLQAVDRGAWMELAEDWTSRGRVLSVAVAGVLELAVWNGSGVLDGAVLALAAIYVLLRNRTDSSRTVAWVDAMSVAGILLVTGGLASSYLMLALVTSIALGLQLGVRSGVATGSLIVLAGILPHTHSILSEEIAQGQLLSWLLLQLLAAGVGGLLVGRRGPRDRDDARALREANRLLRSVHDLAREMPAGMDARQVARVVVDEVRGETDASAVLLVLAEGDEAMVAASYGFDRVPASIPWARVSRLLGSRRAVRRALLDDELVEWFVGSDAWYILPLRHAGVPHGALIVSSDTSGRGSARPVLERIADEAAVALENAEIFGRIHDLAADAERLRIARDLHDGVAQALAHIRLELGMLSQSVSGQASAASIERLDRVTVRAMNDVRKTIDGLRTAATQEGLVAALREHVRDLDGSRSRISLVVRGEPSLPPSAEEHVYRIAQEAIANVAKHARAHQIDVRLSTDDRWTRLSITDDGRGFDASSPATGAGGFGLGLKSMEERASALGGTVRLTSAPGRGTTVDVFLPRKDGRPCNDPSPC